MEHSSRFFRNTACQYFPCHPKADPETFNCLFCYCPLYFLEECGGDGIIMDNGIKNCTPCRIPHQPENYERIVKRLSTAIRSRAEKTLEHKNLSS